MCAHRTWGCLSRNLAQKEYRTSLGSIKLSCVYVVLRPCLRLRGWGWFEQSANLCRLFSKAGDMLVEEAGDDIRASCSRSSSAFRRVSGKWFIGDL